MPDPETAKSSLVLIERPAVRTLAAPREDILPRPVYDSVVPYLPYRSRAGASAAAAFCVLLSACSLEGEGPCPDARRLELELPEIDLDYHGISRHNLEIWVETLTAHRFGGRHAGDPGATAVAALLVEQMAALGLTPHFERASYCQPFELLGNEDVNVVGHLPPNSGEGGWILLGAHYDGQGKHPAGMVYPGADDNASGMAAFLEVMRVTALKREHTVSPSGWIFAAFGGEEVGRVGSRAFLARAAQAPGVELMINLDMVGRQMPEKDSAEALVDERAVIGYRVLSHPHGALTARLRQAAAASGLAIRSLEELGPLMPLTTDADVFAELLPTVLLSTGLHADHHELTDTPEKIDFAQIERTANLVLALADILSQSP